VLIIHKKGDDWSMARKKDVNYFNSFVKLSDYSCQAANLLNKIMKNFSTDELKGKMEEMHLIEHSGDEARHIMVKELAREFITPIDREDIMDLADAIDNVTDTIEDVLMHMYMLNIKHVREDALKIADIVVKCCNVLKMALDEFHNFRKSQILHELIVEVNFLEEEGDKLFTNAIRNLYVNCKDYLEVIAWDQTFHYLEKCCDACEDVANIIESIMMKNT
jgi:predicted phosphate transport protein (TIGR00153 family)